MLCAFLMGMLFTCAANAGPAQLVWPVQGGAYPGSSAAALKTVLQPTVSGKLKSAQYGYTRNSGRKFHEGVDIKGTLGKDVVVAMLPGRVVHVSAKAADSSFGKYVVLLHNVPGVGEVYTLYAHLHTVAVAVHQVVAAGAPLGLLGNTAGGYRIPKSRAHVHVELGTVTRTRAAFEAWYAGKAFKTPNKHGRYNGMNLEGLDVLAAFEAGARTPAITWAEWFAANPSKRK